MAGVGGGGSANAAVCAGFSETQGGQDILSFPQLTAIIMKIHDFCHGFFALPFGRINASRGRRREKKEADPDQSRDSDEMSFYGSKNFPLHGKVDMLGRGRTR